MASHDIASGNSRYFYCVAACRGETRVITTFPGEIATPFYGIINYENSLTCSWRLEAPVGRVSLDIL